MLSTIRLWLFRRRLARILRRHFANCPTGRAFDAALQRARLDNAAWRRQQRRAALRAFFTGKEG